MHIFAESVEDGIAKTGNRFLKIVCIDSDKVKRQVYLWDNVESFIRLYNSGVRIYECEIGGDVNFPKIVRFEGSTGELTDFYTFVYPDDVAARADFNRLLGLLPDGFIKELVLTVMGQPFGVYGFEKVIDAFCVIPAAKAFHHDFRYGLLRHTIEVVEFVRSVSTSALLSKPLDIPLVLAGAMLHDVGKVYEYSFDGVSSAGYGTGLQVNQIYLGSHLYKGAEMVEVAYQDLIRTESYSGELFRGQVEHLKHVILAHHLQREWGAVPKAPQTLEAYLVFLADYYSAAFGKYGSLDWGQVSSGALMKETSKYDSFFGFTPFCKSLTGTVQL